jgi:hypothetical protein
MADVFDRIFKALLPGEPLDVATIANEIGETDGDTFVYLGELLDKRLVTYSGDPFGHYTITEPGYVAAAQSVSIPFEMLQEKLGQPDPTTKTVVSSFSGGAASFATKATYECGCVAYRDHPAALNLGVGLTPCAEHANLFR